MVKNYKIYKESMEWDVKQPYIVSIPSGEVIYCTSEDITALYKLNYIYYDNNRGPERSIYKYICSDLLLHRVLEYLNNKTNDVRLKISNFLMDCGLLKDQFVINDNLSIEAYGPIDMSRRNLTKIPYKFKRCTSDFNCSYNKLSTLENSPFTVNGNFNCSNNLLINLKNGPRLVFRTYNCSNNLIESLDGAPSRLNDFNCSHNFLGNLDYAPTVVHTFKKNDNLFNDNDV